MDLFNKRKFVISFVVIACVGIVLGAYFWINKNELKRSSGKVSVESIGSDEIGRGINFDLKAKTINEIFNESNTLIVRGKVKEISRMKIKVGDIENFGAILTINVNDIIRGDCKANEDMKIFVPLGSTIATISEQIEVGDEGIFMPVKYDESGEEYCKASGNDKLVYKDISDYGLLDGVYYLFIDKNGKIIFDNNKYTDLKSPTSLDDIKTYINKKMNR